MENEDGKCCYRFTARDAESNHQGNITTVDYNLDPTVDFNHNHADDKQKDKNVLIEDDQIALHVMIVKAMGIDDPTHRPFVFNRHYNVVYWVVPGEEIRTRLTEGFDPVWNERGFIFLDNLDDHEFLNVEVQRFNSNNVDPGTSCGKVVVGRARIPFPKELYCKRTGSFSLVRIDGENPKAEGQIVLVMRLERFKLD